MLSSLRSRLSRPEYTGENRCWPCTVVNAAVVLAVSVLVGVFALPLGALVLGVGTVLILLRGYVVPYTPTFAPRLVAALPFGVDVFEGSHTRRADGGQTSGSLTDDVDGDALVRELAEAGVVVADESGELFLADGVRRTWEAGIRRLRDVSDDELAAATASAAPFPADGAVEGDWVVVTRTGEVDDASIDGEEGDEVWLSRAHAVADTAAVAALSEHVDARTAAAAATPMRLFLEHCPLCGGDVEETVAKNCCGGTKGIYDNPETPLLACVDCDELLYEF